MLDSIEGKSGIVFGTAGHIDHGKTKLVRLLTGVDTDRLAEEKKRGISIELGFADLTLADGQHIAIVDVPGHERFIKNMLAGTGGIDAVMLIIAADEGIKPQTREHFDICRLLGISYGLVALTKADLASAEEIEILKEDIAAFCRGSFLEGAACVPVSGQTGAGKEALLQEMMAVAKRVKRRPVSAFARLPVDRSFTMQGFGTVVTGTLLGGALRAGEAIEIHPLRKQLRIRGLQVHRHAVPVAFAGSRTAVNLPGIEAHEIERGAVLVPPDTFEGTHIIDTVVDWLDEKYASRTRQSLRLYAGCLESAADVRLLGPLDSRRTFTRISSREPLLVLPHDRFVLRNAETTVGGGSVIDAFPPVRLNREKTKARLKLLCAASDGERLQMLVEESPQGRKISELLRQTGWSPDRIKQLAQTDAKVTFAETEQRVMSVAWLQQKRGRVIAWLEDFHKQNPAVPGAPMHLVRSGPMSGIAPGISDFILKSEPRVKIAGETVSLASHAATLSPQEAAARQKMETLFRTGGFQPPTLDQALGASGMDAKRARTQLEALIRDRRLVRIGSDLILHVDVVDHVKRSLKNHKGRRFSVPEFKEWTNISRKYAIPILEFLDRERVTRREGDVRVVL